MGGGDWEKEQSSVSLMPDSALCAEDRLSKVMLKVKHIVELKDRVLAPWGPSSISAVAELVEPYPDPKNSPLGPQKVRNDPKIKSKSNKTQLTWD